MAFIFKHTDEHNRLGEHGPFRLLWGEELLNDN